MTKTLLSLLLMMLMITGCGGITEIPDNVASSISSSEEIYIADNTVRNEDKTSKDEFTFL